jgi:thiosulfate dehydrogenase (quinone) large subunit
MKAEKLLVLPRVFIGLIFLVSVYYKLFTDSTAVVQMQGFVGRFGVTHGYEWYRGFLQGVVMPHVGLFAKLVVIGELYVGLGLLFGVTTRLAAGVGIFMLLNFMATKGAMPWNPSICDPPDIVLCLVVMLGAAGRTLGVDRFLHERYPRIPIW